MPFAYAFAAPPTSAVSDGAALRVHSDYALEPYLKLFLAGWPVERRPASDSAAPDIVLAWQGDRLMVGRAAGQSTAAPIIAPIIAGDERDGVNRLADLLSHLAATRSGALVELHAAAVLLGGRLALFVGPSLSGKSTLALQLAARGCRLFGDDRLLVGPLAAPSPAAPTGMALGLTPRVRRPPHPAAGPLFARFVAQHAMDGGGGVGFMNLPVGAVLAPFAATARLGALILPQRRDSGGVSLRPAGGAATVHAMLEQLHAPALPAGAFVAAVHALVEGLPAWRLQYDDSAGAALAVMDRMAGETVAG